VNGESASPALTPRGQVRRRDRLRSEEDAWRFIPSARVAHAAVVTPDGWPYVIPLVFVPDGPSRIWLHTTRSARSAFRQAVAHSGRLCLEFDAMGEVTPGRRFACGSSLAYASVVVFGRCGLVDDPDRKVWFFDRLLERYGRPEWTFEPGYPHASAVVLYEVTVDVVTMKQSGDTGRH